LNHGDHRDHGGILFRELSEKVIGAAIEVHRSLGPGLLESVYESCLYLELLDSGIKVARQVEIPVTYKERPVDCAFRADLLIENAILIELKAVEKLLPIHDAQLLTYLKLAKLKVGLLINFNTTSLRNGIRRLVR